ncbi:hypothetical protein QVD17_32310 [Tagetes erecta]|uniref:Uncharacterized protein n=1 Tax=Tagetes erecta TaxID=13708 RepID=A0AAD8K602_TARER|nr:hypothetical protein QVD17_32310 [Tagetes erecta]
MASTLLLLLPFYALLPLLHQPNKSSKDNKSENKHMPSFYNSMWVTSNPCKICFFQMFLTTKSSGLIQGQCFFNGSNSIHHKS